MKIWKYTLREVEDNPLNADFERGFVKAETFEEAQTKVEKYLKTTWKKLKLDITTISLELEVNIT